MTKPQTTFLDSRLPDLEGGIPKTFSIFLDGEGGDTIKGHRIVKAMRMFTLL